MDNGGGSGAIILLLAASAWFFFGDPPRTIANWFWPDDAAPWETVDAFYYPSSADLSQHVERHGLANVQECRDWVQRTAYQHDDPGMVRSDYECGLGTPSDWNGLKVYRNTVD